MLNLIISLISGAVGGNVAGAAMKENSLGMLGNSIAGIVGGGAGSFILQAMGLVQAATSGGGDMQSIIANVAGGGVSGAVLMAIIGIVKKSMSKA